MRRLLRCHVAEMPDASLGRGLAGLAVAHSFFLSETTARSNEARSRTLLNRSIEAVARRKMPLGLYSGWVGVAWSAEHVRNQATDQTGQRGVVHSRLGGHVKAGVPAALVPDGSDENEAVDEILGDLLTTSPWPHPFDLISGLVGIGVYLLERPSRATVPRLLDLLVDRLEETSVRTGPGIAWPEDPDNRPGRRRGSPGRRQYDLGVAHGTPGVIGLLAGLAIHKVAPHRVRRMLDGAVRWLLAQRLPESMEAWFPTRVGDGLEPVPSRSAWCYGDPGIAVMLLHAALASKEPIWEDIAIQVAMKAVRRSPERCGVVDAGLCHGSSGLGHVFHRLYRMTGEKALARAALFWLKRTLDLRTPGRGIAGFRARRSLASGRVEWVTDPGFLEGAGGIALSLSASLSDDEPSWDRVLLLSQAPRA